ncbi:MAG TPA: hypothetical protein VGD09_17870, partial [Blastococcus sp.]
MSLKPPSLWIEQRGQQHLVYWRNTLPGLPARGRPVSFPVQIGVAGADLMPGVVAAPRAGTHVSDRAVGGLDWKPQCAHVPHVRQHVRVDAPEHSRLEIRIHTNQTAVRIHKALNHVDRPLQQRHRRVSVERGALRVQRRSHLLRQPFGS